MGEMSKLGCLICWSSRDMLADSLYFLYVALGSICKALALFLPRMHVGLTKFKNVFVPLPKFCLSVLPPRPILSLCLSDQYSVKMHKKPRDIVLQRTGEIRHTVPKHVTRNMRT
jgi:hypothetical protein